MLRKVQINYSDDNLHQNKATNYDFWEDYCYSSIKRYTSKNPKAKNDNRSNLSEKLHYEVNLRRFSLDFLHNFQVDIDFVFPLGN